MQFSALENSIASPAIRAVAAHWNAARASRLMPSWSDIRPSAIPRHLPIVWSYRYDPASDEFVGRLAGEQIVRFFSHGIRGMPLAAIHSKENFPWVFGLFKKVTTSPALYRSEGCIFKHINRVGMGERIMLPLASDGEKADGIFGATEYRLTSDMCETTHTPLANEEWF
jgi:hypothetical protein